MNIENYKTVTEFYEDAKLSKLIKERGLTLQEAYNLLCERELMTSSSDSKNPLNERIFYRPRFP